MKHLVLCAGLLAAAQAAAQTTPGKYAWQDFSQRTSESQKVQPLGANFAGDAVALANGALSFTLTDISIPGNLAGLPVEFTRSYQVKNRQDLPTQEMLADWEVEVPRITGVFTPDWLAQGSNPGSRCSTTMAPLPPASTSYSYSDYWSGLTIVLPGAGPQALLVAGGGIVRPSAGGPYPWVAQDGRTHVACLPSIKNGMGQGFIASLTDGTRVWFDHMAQYYLSPLKGKTLDPTGAPKTELQDRRLNALYATRIEDRFGNHVTYTYENTWNQPAKLKLIQASDGRALTVAYSGSYVSSVSDGTHTWNYAYADLATDGGHLPRGRKTLTSVVQPDGTAWQIGFSEFTNAWIQYHQWDLGEIYRSCFRVEVPVNYAVEPVGTVVHPSGAAGTFTVNIQEHGRSNVPINCRHVGWTGSPGEPYGLANNTNDDIPYYAISDNSFSLKQKKISGPGMATWEWNYSYNPGVSWVFKNGATRFYPVCDYKTYTPEQCAAPPKCGSPAVNPCEGSSTTTVSGTTGEWQRYTYGNSYRHNEGKLLKVESGVDATNILRTATYAYDFSQENRAYPASFGGNLRPYYDGFDALYHRPLLSTRIIQQGASFTSENEAFDAMARPKQVKKSSAPLP